MTCRSPRTIPARPLARPLAGPLAKSLAVALALLATGAAHADDVDQAVQKVIHLDQVIHIMALEFSGSPRNPEPLAESRVVDAQGLLARGRIEEATTILLDVVNKWPMTRAAHDATFFLGDALFRLGDFLSARTFYEKAIAEFTGTNQEQQALGRLVEISLRTGDFEPVDGYLRLLEKVRPRALDPCVPYVKAKLAYHRGNLADAARIFASIPPTSPYSWQARYFLGTIKVKAGDLAAAATAFEAVLRTTAADDQTREIQDLARLALARICFWQERLACAQAHYQAVRTRPKSKVSSDALYELGFTYVRSQDFDKAHGTFDRLLRVDPESAQVFEVKLLLGSLQLRRGDLGVARRSFSATRDELGPSYGKLREIMARIDGDPGFLDAVAQGGLDEIALGAFSSPAARNWVRADPEVERLLTLSRNIAGSPRGIAEVKNTLRRIEGVLANPDSQILFPDLTRVRSALTEVSVQLLALRGPFFARARRLEHPHLLASEASLLDRNAAEREGIERQLAARLTSNSQPGAGRDGRDLGQALDPDGDRDPSLSVPPPRAEGGLVAAGQLLVTSWRLPGQSWRFETERAQPAPRSTSDPAARDPAAGVRAPRVRAAPALLERLLRQEQQVHQAVRAKMNPSERSELERDLEVLARTDATLSQLAALDARVDSEIDVRLEAAKDFVMARRQEVAAEDDKLAIVLGDARTLGGSFVQLVCARLADRLYDLVVRADVGLIDVAWAIKQRSSAVVRAVQAEKNRELDALAEGMKREEAALSRRFAARDEWAKYARLRLRMPVPKPTAH